MNQLEKNVADRSLCEKLDPKEWGDTAFVWIDLDENLKIFAHRPEKPKVLLRSEWDKISSEANGIMSYPAPIFAEVWAKLSSFVYSCEDKNLKYWLRSYKNGEITGCEYVTDKGVLLDVQHDEKPVNAALKLYDWCKQERYI